MSREIVDVTRRCPACDMGTTFLVRYEELTYGGEPLVIVQSERVPHTRSDCERMVTLRAEQWPSLW